MVDNWNLIWWQPPTASVMPPKERDHGSPFPNWLPSPGMQLPPDLALSGNLYGCIIFWRTAITSYNKPDGLIEHKFTLTYFWNPKIQYQFHRAKIQVSLGLYLEAVLESLSLPPPADVILGPHQFLLIPLHLLFCVSQVSSGWPS